MDISKASAGYSVDNINPAVPTGLSIVQVSNGLELSWNVIEDLDFQYYKIERSTNESFESHEVFYTVENNYMDLNVENSNRISTELPLLIIMEILVTIPI